MMGSKQHGTKPEANEPGDPDVYNPTFDWQHNDANYVIRLSLSGFGHEDLKVHVDDGGRLTVWGSRPASGADGKRLRFCKEWQLPDIANVGEVSARFEPARNVLTLTVPKLPATEIVEIERAAGGLVETVRKNKQEVLIVATAIAAFSLGVFVSHKLFSGN